MARPDLSWDHWQSFLAVVEQGSLSGAARRLGLTQPTLGRHIAALEQGLGAALFLRAPSGLMPTDLARRLVPEARAMAAAAGALQRRASGEAGAEEGVVRLAASEMVGVEVLPPMLARFRAAHPGIAIELVLSNRNEDLLRHEADLALRMARPVQGALVARKLADVQFGLYARADFLQAAGMPQDLDGAIARGLIGPEDPRILAAVRLGGRALRPEDLALRSDDDVAQLALVRAGAGIGLCQQAIAARDPRLVPVLPGLLELRLPAHMVMHEDLRASRRVRLLFDHLAREASAFWSQARSSLGEPITT